MEKQKRRGIKQIANAAKWSIQGLIAAFKHESSFRLEIYLSIILLPTAIYIATSPLQLLILLAPIILVLVVEILNSAIEAVVDMVCEKKFHELAKRAKDMGSAAVFLTQLMVVYFWSTIIYQNYG